MARVSSASVLGLYQRAAESHAGLVLLLKTLFGSETRLRAQRTPDAQKAYVEAYFADLQVAYYGPRWQGLTLHPADKHGQHVRAMRFKGKQILPSVGPWMSYKTPGPVRSTVEVRLTMAGDRRRVRHSVAADWKSVELPKPRAIRETLHKPRSGSGGPCASSASIVSRLLHHEGHK